MTALALDVRELSFAEIDLVSGGEITWDDVREAVGSSLVTFAVRMAFTPVGFLALCMLALSATPAGEGSDRVEGGGTKPQ
ncbi:hypothetical protein [Brevundimonas sp. TWP2-3-4b2]|uniref:hypothetical protein n=1 Tax=Brevundimonas sp. TWP2-3-4b2 TaxID=2804595 RepID=UPI003CEDBFE5